MINWDIVWCHLCLFCVVGFIPIGLSIVAVIDKIQDRKTKFWNKSFPITSICREDLTGKFTEKQIRQLDDDDMKHIASKMADNYCDNGFWIDMSIIVGYLLEQRGE